MKKIWDIHGGIHPPENKAQSNQLPIATIPLANELILPLSQHIGTPATPCVAVGDKVLKGQKIAEAQGFISVPVHASTSGKIIAIEDRPIAHPSGMSAPCIILQPDGLDTWCDLTPLRNWQQESPDVLAKHIRDAGIAGMGGAGFPTAVKMQPAAHHTIDTLILNGTECEPYITADDVLMRYHANELVKGAALLGHILGSPKRLIIGIEDNKPEAIKAVEAAIKSCSIKGAAMDVVSFPTKYPSGGEKQLIQIVTGKEIPSGKIPADIGIVVQNVATAVAAYRAITFGEPLISRITTVVGETLSVQRNVYVPLGTPMHHVLSEHGFNGRHCARLIVGGPMMGFTLEHADAAVVKTTNCLLVPSHSEMPEPEPQQACIRCGMCAEACPASLLPQQLLWFSQAEDFDRLNSHNLFDCIECGACSYVCPSNIPLVQYYRASKTAIRIHDEEKRKSEQSRQRFEFRKARLEKAEAEKEAQRKARKLAAEKAKAKLAESPKQSDTETVKPIADITPEKQRAKLERAVGSAQSRVDRAKKQLDDALALGDSARIEALQARNKEAELKLRDAKSKLEHFDSNSTTPNAKQADNADTGAKIKEKLAQSPIETLQKSLESINTRIATAEEKLHSARENNAPTTAALEQGVEKLVIKRGTLEAELANIRNTPSQANTTEIKIETKALSAADKAIENAKAKAEALANMSAEEKKQTQIVSLQQRIEKAKVRLHHAQENNDENVAAFQNALTKLEQKFEALNKS